MRREGSSGGGRSGRGRGGKRCLWRRIGRGLGNGSGEARCRERCTQRATNRRRLRVHRGRGRRSKGWERCRGPGRTRARRSTATDTRNSRTREIRHRGERRHAQTGSSTGRIRRSWHSREASWSWRSTRSDACSHYRESWHWRKGRQPSVGILPKVPILTHGLIPK